MIRTPETDPDHEVIGRRFRGMCLTDNKSVVLYCDSYDPRIGYWMRRADAPLEHHQDDGTTKWRRNVSEAAIGRTFHHIHTMSDGFEHSRWGAESRNYPKDRPMTNEELLAYAADKIGFPVKDGMAIRMAVPTFGDDCDGDEHSLPAGATGFIDSIEMWDAPQKLTVTVVIACNDGNPEHHIVQTYDETDERRYPFGPIYEG